MSDSLFEQLKARGEGFFTEISNNLMANPAFIEVLKKGIAAKEEVDKRVAEGLKVMNVATRKDVSRLEKRLAELEAELGAVKAKAAARPPAPRIAAATTATEGRSSPAASGRCRLTGWALSRSRSMTSLTR